MSNNKTIEARAFREAFLFGLGATSALAVIQEGNRFIDQLSARPDIKPPVRTPAVEIAVALRQLERGVTS